MVYSPCTSTPLKYPNVGININISYISHGVFGKGWFLSQFFRRLKTKTRRVFREVKSLFEISCRDAWKCRSQPLGRDEFHWGNRSCFFFLGGGAGEVYMCMKVDI